MFNNSTGYAVRCSVAVSERTFLPIDIWINPFKPGHSQDNLVGTEGGNKKDFFMFDASEGKLQPYDAVGMK